MRNMRYYWPTKGVTGRQAIGYCGPAGFKLSYESVIMAKTAALGLVFA
jgi:hypothetical protein